MGRTKRLSRQDQMMRRDGYVTAVEVSEATGLVLSAIHRGIDDGRIPGKTVRVSDKYAHRYVDIKAFIKIGNFGDTKTIKDNLDRLTAAVSEARADRSTSTTPRTAP